MTKQTIVFELLLSLNKGNSGNVKERVEIALVQYEQLTNHGVALDAKRDLIPPNPKPKTKNEELK